MKNFKSKVAVITGAGSGIGQSLALKLRQARAHLALCDLNYVGLEETTGLMAGDISGVSVHNVDVSDPSQMAKFAEDVLARHHQVDILINNAGITVAPTEFLEINPAHFEKIIAVNMWGTYYGTREFLPHLKMQSEASIVNISSLAGLVGLYGYAPYAMSKFAIRALSEVLQSELATTDVSVLIVHPGGVKTNIIKNAPNLVDSQQESAHQIFTQNAWMTSEDAARKILWAVQKKRKRLIIGVDAKIIYAVRVLFPRLYPRILRVVFSYMTFQ